MKVVRIFLKPGGMRYVDITPTNADFNYPNFMTGVKAHGFQNDSCCIPWDSIQCTMFDEQQVLNAMEVPVGAPSPYPQRPN